MFLSRERESWVLSLGVSSFLAQSRIFVRELFFHAWETGVFFLLQRELRKLRFFVLVGEFSFLSELVFSFLFRVFIFFLSELSFPSTELLILIEDVFFASDSVIVHSIYSFSFEGIVC